jgi:hypothetical protein
MTTTGGDVADDHDRRFQCGERFVVGMLVAPPIAMLGLAFGDAIGDIVGAVAHGTAP